jgi:4-hydroxy-tetrahydrodipicolinate reductase
LPPSHLAVARRQPDGIVAGSAQIDVLIDYTSPAAVKGNALAAIDAGVAVVIGTPSLTAADFSELDTAARHLPQWEVIDYASATKPDVPSGTAHELAERLGKIREPAIGAALDKIHGPREARGASIGGARVHSVRLPSFTVSTEVVFGLPDERLTICHDAGGSPEPNVAGTLLAARKAPALVGLTRGLDTLLLHAG